MRFYYVSAAIALLALACSPSGAQLFGLGMPTAHTVQPIRPQTTGLTRPGLESLPGLAQPHQPWEFQAPKQTAPGPDGSQAAAPIIGAPPAAGTAPVAGSATAVPGMSVLGDIVEAPISAATATFVEGPVISAEMIDLNAPPKAPERTTEEWRRAPRLPEQPRSRPAPPERAPQTPTLGPNALSDLSLTTLTFTANAPASLAPTSLGPSVYAPSSLAPVPVEIKSGPQKPTALQILSLPIVDLMGVTPRPRKQSQR